MRRLYFIMFLVVCTAVFCGCKKTESEIIPVAEATESRIDTLVSLQPEEIIREQPLKGADIQLNHSLLYDKHTLADEYPHGDTVRSFQWKRFVNALPL